MNSFLFRSAIAVFGFASLYLSSDQNARADDWGCKIILCLSNPGGPTQYAECRPPVQKLWGWLASSKSFPTCSGVGFQSSRPHYDPFYCKSDHHLVITSRDKGREAFCVSMAMQVVNTSLCRHDRDWPRNDKGTVIDARWQSENGHRQCMGHTTSRPLVRERPHYIDVTIDGVGRLRVWF